MKKSITISFLTIMVVLLAGQAIVAQDENPNGFPSGPHFNLNIIGKKDTFMCPEQKYYLEVITCVCGAHQAGDLVESCTDGDECEQTNIPIYGKVVFVPENGEGIEIYMESGKAGGKGSKNLTLPDTLQVTDPCAGFDGDGATLQLPKNEDGYRVYARALAKPGEDTFIKITPDLVMVEDENGNYLVYLGLVTDNGFQLPDQTFERRKGRSIAINITGLFLWSGTVCYLTDPGDGSAVPTLKCGIDTSEPPDGIIDTYVDPDPETGLCPEGSIPTTVYCTSYEDKWVFNIGDFVTYLWSVDNNGTKLLQVRFYPNNPELMAPSKQNNLTTRWGKIKAE